MMSKKTTLDDFFVKDIYVLDTETTGLKGAPDDVIVDIGVCKVDIKSGTVKPVYSSVVGYETSKWNDYRRNAWIFDNTDLTLDMVHSAPPFSKVLEDISALLSGNRVTSYNTEYDMDKFLYRDPWSMKGQFTLCTDIMKAAMYVCKVPSQYYGREYQYPKLDLAYSTITDGDPAGIGGKQDHRALSDAMVASHVMIQMYRDGTYSL
jgi:DNA polymerase-3 subunit epsilon